MSAPRRRIGADAIGSKGRLAAHRFLIARRVVQLGVLGLFLAGPLAGIWIVKGNLNYSLTLGALPLADPYVVLQSLLAGHAPQRTALVGAAIVLAFYLLVGGRAYCAWVCPLNAVTDLAAWLRRRTGLKTSLHLSRSLRHALLGLTLLLAAATGSIAWELLNPVSIVARGLVFGMGAAWAVVLAVFLFDLFVSQRGWCGHLCPAGAFWGGVARASPLRVRASGRVRCNDCMDCHAVCPEVQVLKPALKGTGPDGSPVILSPSCTNCGRCIDVCSRDVFEFGLRWDRREAGREPGPRA